MLPISITEINSKEQLDDLIESGLDVVVKFWATWCGPCAKYAPHFQKASERSEAIFASVDIDTAPWAMVDYGIQSVPTTKLFRNGEFDRDIAKTPANQTVLKLLAEI